MRRFFILQLSFCLFISMMKGQTLSLQRAIETACNHSLQSHQLKNEFKANEWNYRLYKAGRLPSLILDMNPASYNRNIIQRYMPDQNIDVYRTQQALSSSGDLSITQNVLQTGGTIYVKSSLGYYRSFGDIPYTQFTTVPVLLGYSQQLVGFNQFKWDKKIETFRHDEAAKEWAYGIAGIAVNITDLYFKVLSSRLQIELAQEERNMCDTLLAIGKVKNIVGRMTSTDLLNIELEKTKADNALIQSNDAFFQATMNLSNALNSSNVKSFNLSTPFQPCNIHYSVNELVGMAMQNNPLIADKKMVVLSSQRDCDKAKKQRFLEAGIDVSVGFNQYSDHFGTAYHHPMRQDIVAVTLKIPLVDWGTRKGNLRKAELVLQNSKEDEQLTRQAVRTDVLATYKNYLFHYQSFSVQQKAVELAKRIYQETFQRYTIGRGTLENLFLAHQKYTTAQVNYLSNLQQCWNAYYVLCQLTLYDFENKKMINSFIGY